MPRPVHILLLAIFLALLLVLVPLKWQVFERFSAKVPVRPHAVLVCIAGQTRELMRPDVVQSLEDHVLKIIANEHMLHVALNVDVFPRHAVERARLYGNVYVNVSAANTMFERRLFCNTCYSNITSPVRWVICTRPDLFYFEDVPALQPLPPGVHMRTRIIVTTQKVYQSTMSWNWWIDKWVLRGQAPQRSVPCDRVTAEGNAGCATFDDQVAIMDPESFLTYIKFGSNLIEPATNQNHSKCRACRLDTWNKGFDMTQSPEYRLTVYLISHGIPVHILSWTIRLARLLCQDESMWNTIV